VTAKKQMTEEVFQAKIDASRFKKLSKTLANCATFTLLAAALAACAPTPDIGDSHQEKVNSDEQKNTPKPAHRPAAPPMRRLDIQKFDINEAQLLPDKPISELYPGLLLEAKSGDIVAMRKLFIGLSRCWHSMSSREGQMDPETIDAGILAASGLTRKEFINHWQRNELLQTDGMLHECQKLPEGAMADTSHWLISAAQGGDIYAQLTYANYRDLVVDKSGSKEEIEDQNREFDKTSMTYLKALAAEGSADAMYKLGTAYEVGYITEKDIVRAYAYKLAYSEIDPHETNKGELNRIAKMLSKEQLLKAEQLAPSLK